MKKLSIILIMAVVTGCTTKPNCTFTKLEISTQVNDGEMTKKTLEGCFTKQPADNLGLVEITDADNRIKISYYNEQPLKILNTKFGNQTPVEWRTNKGHDLFLIEKTDSLGFIFGDRNSAAGKVKGSILLIK